MNIIGSGKSKEGNHHGGRYNRAYYFHRDGGVDLPGGG
jgi:hypothetical protein